MQLQKILTLLKEESKITFWLSLLPITLLVGILWQIAILSKYNAIAFFSWWQVLNDTAILIPQLIVSFLWVLSAYIYYLVNTTKKEKWISWMILFLFSIIISSINSWFFENNYLNCFIYSFMLWYFSYVIVKIIWNKWNEQEKYDNYIIPTIMVIFVLLVVFLFWRILNYFYSFLYQNIEIKLDKNYQINYINDKYIFYSSWSETKVIPNDWKNEFIINKLLKK